MAGKSDKPIDISGAMIERATEVADWLIIAPVVIPMLFGAIILMLRRRTEIHPLIANIAMAVHLIACAGLLGRVMDNGPIAMTMGRWLPPFGISFSVDMTGALFCFTASIVGLVCSVYSVVDIGAAKRRNGFYVFLLLMMAGVSGAFLTGDLFNLYVWFEVVLISSFGLIVLGSTKMQLDGTIKYAFLNFIATTLFLIATAYLYGVVGTLNMADIIDKAQPSENARPLVSIAALFCLAFAMKAAAFPLNFWLPASYHTPGTVVSALFAGLLTKVGLYALLRTMTMLLAFQRNEIAFWIGVVAVATMLLGALGALAQSDIRKLAGYVVIVGIGIMLTGIAIPANTAIQGAIAYALHSIIVMTGLYLAIGIVGRNAGSFHLKDLGGQYAQSPLFAVGFFILIVSVAGLPIFSGFWPKLQLVRTSIVFGVWWIPAAILFSSLIVTIALFRVWAFAFWRGGPEGVPDGAENWKLEKLSQDEALTSYLCIGVLVALTTVFGIYPEPVLSLVSEAASVLEATAPYQEFLLEGRP